MTDTAGTKSCTIIKDEADADENASRECYFFFSPGERYSIFEV